MKVEPVHQALSFKAIRSLFLTVALAALTTTSPAVDVNSQELALFNLMKNHPGQRRASVELDPILCKVARAKAADMAARGYFSHTDPNGRGANTLVRQAGYVLPAGYDTSLGGNNIESLSAGRETAGQVWNDFLGSDPHRRHLLGEASFFAGQTSVGVGYVNVPGSQWQWYWVVLSAPPSGPQLFITAPKGGSEVNDPFVTVAGSTGGEPAAASVQARVENANGESAWVTAQGIETWTANVDGLTPGANTLRIQSLSNTGAVLRDVTRTVRYVVLAPVTINVNGNGTITKGFAGTTQREVARTYTVTATTKAGSIFAGWSGGAATLARTITFTVPEGGLTLDANFILNPFTAGVGGYSGLFTGNDGTHGAVNVNLLGNGTFTGRIRLGSETVAIKGRFDATGAAELTVASRSGATFSLALNYSETAGSITGTVSGEGWSADLALDALSKPATTANPNAGRYTLVIASAEAAGAPAGDGAAVVTVNKAGFATVTGALADGTAFTARGRLTNDSALNLFIPLHSRAGLLTGALHFRTQAASDIDGTLFWARPAVGEDAAFAVEVAAIGSRYTAPTLNQPILPVSNNQDNTSIALGDGGLEAPVVQPATLSNSNTLTISAPAVSGLTARINPARGNFSGRFIHPETGAETKFRGVILQKQGAGFGFFAGGADAGYATFAPAEVQASLVAE